MPDGSSSQAGQGPGPVPATASELLRAGEMCCSGMLCSLRDILEGCEYSCNRSSLRGGALSHPKGRISIGGRGHAKKQEPLLGTRLSCMVLTGLSSRVCLSTSAAEGLCPVRCKGVSSGDCCCLLTVAVYKTDSVLKRKMPATSAESRDDGRPL